MKIIEAMCYIFKNKPSCEYYKKRYLIYLLYLADWKHSITYGIPIFNIEWMNGNYGAEIKGFIKNECYYEELLDIEKYSIDHVIKIAEKHNSDQMITIVLSTYPIMMTSRYSPLHLIELAQKYNEINKKIKGR